MTSEEMQELIYRTIENISQDLLNKTNYLYVVEGKITEVDSLGNGYVFEYQSEKYNGFSITGETYSVDDLVYVLFSNNKNIKKMILSKTKNFSNNDINRFVKKTDKSISQIKLENKQISLEVSGKVGKDEVISCINQTPESITIKAQKISLEGVVTANNYFQILEDGSMRAVNSDFSGRITANSGSIGGWTIEEGSLIGDRVGLRSQNEGTNKIAIWAGSSIPNGAPFYVTNDGFLKTSNAEIQGSISGSTITGGTVSGTTINGGTINGTTINTDKDLHVGNNIYINSEVQTQKFIYFTADSFIRMFLTSGWEYLAIESGRVALRSTQLGQAEVYAWTEPDMGVISAGMAVYRKSGGTNVQAASFRLEGDSGDVEVTANGTFSGNKQYRVTSDIRLKENIEDIDLTGILDIMRVKKYNLIGSPEKTVGVIAQDFIGTEYEDIIIKKDKRGYYAVDYNVILMAIVQKLKEVMEDSFEDEAYLLQDSLLSE